MINTGNRNSHGTTQLIKTSKGRTVIDIAIEEKNIDILQYLVNQKKVSVSSEGGKNNMQALSALEAVLKAMPESADKVGKKESSFSQISGLNCREKIGHGPYNTNPPLYKISSPRHYRDFDTGENDQDSYNTSLDDSEADADRNKLIDEDESVATTVQDPVRI